MSTRKSGFFAAATLVSLVTAFGQAPANDDFANRTALAGSSITFSGTLAGATLENAETNSSFPGGPLNSGGSVWWTWTASESTTVVIAMLRDYSVVSSTNTRLYVYTGTDLNGLTLLDNNSFDAPPGRYVAFSASAGASYLFRVAGGWGQSFTLNLTATNPPVFLIQPQDSVVSPYGSAFLSAIATGLRSNGWQKVSAAKYQWTFNGVPIPGQRAPSLVIYNVTTNPWGSYSVTASNAGGLTESAPATVTVTETNPVPRLAAMSPSSPSLLSFFLTGEGRRWYKIESSRDLKTWTNSSWVQNTNETSFLSVPRLVPRHFVRASLNAPTDACVAQLKQLRAAQYMVAIENRLPAWSTIALEHLKPYLVLGPATSLIPCPEYGTYIAPATVSNNPTCSLQSRGHQITGP
jgi:hypothetical protein